jgi:hypothetical protein
VPANGTLASDFLPIYIPKGAIFWVRLWLSALNNFSFNDVSNGPVIDAAIGDGQDTNTTNEGATCASVATGSSATIFPMMIVAQTRRPSFEIIGDSRAAGLEDSFNGTSGDIGNIARTIGPLFAYANFGRSNAYASSFASGVQTQVQKYFSHQIQQRGVNDLRVGGLSVAQTQAAIVSIFGLFPGRTVYQSTFEANTTSTDNWTTTANQTPAADNANISTLSTNTRANSFIQPRGILDVTNALNSSRTSGLWGVLSGPTAMTNDGLHCVQAGCINIVTQHVINNNRFTRQSPGRTN